MLQLLFQTCLMLCFSQHALASCNPDNCLNALRNHAESASLFCTPFLAVVKTATTGYPAYASPCSASTSRLSSACSCVLASTSNPTTTGTGSPTSTSTTTQCGSMPLMTDFVTTLQCPIYTVTVLGNNTVTETVTVTTTASSVVPTCAISIEGGNFEDPVSGNLAEFTVDSQSIYNIILAPNQQNALEIPSGITQFLFLNFEGSIFGSSNYTLQQAIQPLCAPYTSITLTATIITQYSGGSVLFCISDTTCSSPQQVSTGDAFNPYSATFLVARGTPITVTMILMFSFSGGNGPFFFAGIGSFSASAA